MLAFLLLVPAAGQAPPPDGTFEHWQQWVAAAVSGAALARDGGAAAWAALGQVRAALATAGADDARTVNLHRAATRLSVQLAAYGTWAGLPADEELLRSALPSAERAQNPADAAYVYALLADEVGRQGRLTEKESILRQSLAVVHGPERVTPLMALARMLVVAQDAYAEVLELVAAAEVATGTAGATPRWRADILETRARANLGLGRLDVAGADIRSALDLVAAESSAAGYRDRITSLRIEYAFAVEDYETVVELVPPLVEKPPRRAELLRMLALSRWRLRDAALHTGDPILALAAEAVANAREDDVAVRTRASAALMLCEAGDVAAAAALVEQARAVSTARAPRLGARAQLAVLRAHVALLSQAPVETLSAIRAELVDVADALTGVWRSVPPQPGGIGFLNLTERRNVFSALARVERRLHPDRPELALAHVLRPQIEGSLARRLDLAAVDVPTLQREVAPLDGGLLVFLPSFVGSHVFAVTRSRVLHVELPRQDVFRRQVHELRRHLLDEHGGDAEVEIVRDLGARIRAWLIPPAIAALVTAWPTWGVVGRDLLYDLPLEGLPGFASAWLGVEKAIYYVPSAPLAVHRRARADAVARLPSAGVAVVAVTEPVAAASGVAPLPIPLARLQDLVSPWPDALLVSGAAAGAGVLSSPRVAASGLLHVLAHGVGGLVTPAGIPANGFAASDGIVTSTDVERLGDEREGGPPLVVLSICGSARGSPRRGEDTGSHLAGAFLRAGALAVVAADTEINAAAALAFSTHLHAALADGLPVARACQRARGALLGDPRFGHPAHHAVMAVWGAGGLMLPRAGASPGVERLVWSVALVAVLVGVVAMRSRCRRGVAPPS